MKDAAILFLLIVTVGLFVIMWREHRAPEVFVDQTVPAAPAITALPPASHWQFKQPRIA